MLADIVMQHCYVYTGSISITALNTCSINAFAIITTLTGITANTAVYLQSALQTVICLRITGVHLPTLSTLILPALVHVFAGINMLAGIIVGQH